MKVCCGNGYDEECWNRCCDVKKGEGGVGLAHGLFELGVAIGICLMAHSYYKIQQDQQP